MRRDGVVRTVSCMQNIVIPVVGRARKVRSDA
jgi:hypothetical protein